MKDTYNKIYQEFCDNTKNTFYLNIVSILLIFLFILTPFIPLSGFIELLLKLIIISILSYSLYITINSSNSLLDIDNIFTNPNLATVRNNYILNLVYSIVVGILIFYIIYGFF